MCVYWTVQGSTEILVGHGMVSGGRGWGLGYGVGWCLYRKGLFVWEEEIKTTQ